MVGLRSGNVSEGLGEVLEKVLEKSAGEKRRI
jgi:hypothetical protein